MGLEFFGTSEITYPTTESYIPQKLKLKRHCDKTRSRNHISSFSMHEYKLLVLPTTLE
jgi:hypothetical protein